MTLTTTHSKTTTLYTYIRDQQYHEAIKLLIIERINTPRSRTCLSLLAYSYYMIQDYINASLIYYDLTVYHSDVIEYHLYYIQSLIKSSQYSDALSSIKILLNSKEF